jgi:hydrogenase maturation factor
MHEIGLVPDLALAIVQVDGGFARDPVYVRKFFKRELGFAETAVVFNVNDLLSLGAGPC